MIRPRTAPTREVDVKLIHTRTIDIGPRFIPLIEDLEVDWGDLIEFRVAGGVAWILIPGASVVPVRGGDRGVSSVGDAESASSPPFTAFAVTQDTPVKVEVVGTDKPSVVNVIPYSVLCSPGEGGRSYYAQGASPPRIVLPPPKDRVGGG
jgi:hypothetical protein